VSPKGEQLMFPLWFSGEGPRGRSLVHISRVRIANFANFQALDIETGEDIVIVGENKVGKSNFLPAIQLILDPSLSERDRRLGLEHFWDGLGDDKLGAIVEVSIELTETTVDPRLLRYLADCVVKVGPPFVDRLTYRYQPKPGLGRAPTGDDRAQRHRPDPRRREHRRHSIQHKYGAITDRTLWVRRSLPTPPPLCKNVTPWQLLRHICRVGPVFWSRAVDVAVFGGLAFAQQTQGDGGRKPTMREMWLV
jgi:hypothetical protein